MEKRRIAILGSTGSIGTQTLDVVRAHRDLFEVELISCRNNVEALVRQAVEFDVNHAVICNESRYKECADALAGTDTKVFSGIRSLCDLVASDRVDIVVASMVGFSGLAPTLSAIRAGKIIALANKETLVAAGSLVMGEAHRCHAPILPVDSEHSAIFQCLLGAQGNAVDRLILTASGGPFRTWEKDRIALATRDMALNHPRWNMGPKITVDSATMMNKGFEVIEASWLFEIPQERIEVLVHPESIVHSMIAYEDGAVLAQMANPDMRQPIGFALAFPERLPLPVRKLDLAEIGELHFSRPDEERFPALAIAREATRKGGNIPCALNAANEAAVSAFLQERLSFYGITYVVREIVESMPLIERPTLDDIFETHREAFGKASELIDRMERRDAQ